MQQGIGATEARRGGGGACPQGTQGMAVCTLWTRSAPSRHGLLIVDSDSVTACCRLEVTIFGKGAKGPLSQKTVRSNCSPMHIGMSLYGAKRARNPQRGRSRVSEANEEGAQGLWGGGGGAFLGAFFGFGTRGGGGVSATEVRGFGRTLENSAPNTVDSSTWSTSACPRKQHKTQEI